ncbi:hypothetical protein [Mycobacterium ulcerans]|uniref:hypothetical protein n=1 Tax=Mycobacterium ulcerans TaxID=1809 RepID=UPI001F059CD2|nr:hypothetical protein [Mycobacterium ulcerans]
MPLRLIALSIAVAIFPLVCNAPKAGAAPQGSVPCAVPDQIRNILDNQVSPGINETRRIISSPYLSGGWQRRDATGQLNTMRHGILRLQDLNADHNVPGLEPLLGRLDRASNNLQKSVEGLYWLDDGSTSLAWPEAGTWGSFDYMEEQTNAVYGLANDLSGKCS